MIIDLFESKKVNQEKPSKDIEKMLDDLRNNGINVVPLSQDKYKFNYNGTDCIIDTKDYNKKKKVTYHIKGLFKWYKLAFGILLFVKLIWLLRFFNSQVIVPEDREARAEYDRKRQSSIGSAIGGIMSIYGSFV